MPASEMPTRIVAYRVAECEVNAEFEAMGRAAALTPNQQVIADLVAQAEANHERSFYPPETRREKAILKRVATEEELREWGKAHPGEVRTLTKEEADALDDSGGCRMGASIVLCSALAMVAFALWLSLR